MMTKSFYHRETCRLCDSRNIELVVPLVPIPLPDKYVTQDKLGQDPEVYPIDLYMCCDCGHVQLLDVVDPDILWDNNFSYLSGRTKGLIKHFENVVEKLMQRYKPVPTKFSTAGK